MERNNGVFISSDDVLTKCSPSESSFVSREFFFHEKKVLFKPE